MKNGKSLVELAQELQRQMETKKDYLADTRRLTLTEDGKELSGLNGHAFEVTGYAHEQLATRLKIPRPFYERLRIEHPDMLAWNVNNLFQREPEKRMIRTLDGKARAFLSDRFRPIDNFDLAEAVLPKIQQMGCRVESCELTEKRMYIQAVTDKISGEIRKGDAVQAGIVISNSEVGAGSVMVSPLIFRLVCTNGMIAADHSLRKYHVGKIADSLEGAVEFYTSRTIAADNRAFFMKVQDIVAGALSTEGFQSIVSRLRDTTKNQITAQPEAVVEEVTGKYQMQEEEGRSILHWLLSGGDLTQYGLIQAITRSAQDTPDYDRAIELEKIGGEVMEITGTEWEKLAA